MEDNNILNPREMRTRLIDLIIEHAFQYSETPKFKLAYGGISQYYFNCKRVTLDPEGQYLIGNLVFDAVRDLHIRGIGGLTLGADPISNAAAYSSWLRGQPIQSFVVRKAQKDHGIIAPVEGKVGPGDRVVVVDDVVTTGSSTLQAISACRQARLEIVGVVTLIDRQEMNGRENIEKEVPDFKALFTRDEIMDVYLKRS
jgi:orotate phosphoribosyltransferase